MAGWAGGWPGWESARPESTASQPSQDQPSKALPGVLPIVKNFKVSKKKKSVW